MASDTQLSFAAAMQVFLGWSIMNSMTREAVHGLPGTRIRSTFAHRMSDLVLMSMALTAKLDGVVGEQERAVATVSGVTDPAGQIGPVRDVATWLPRFRTAWIVTGKADLHLFCVKHGVSRARMSVVAARAAGPTAGGMGKGCLPDFLDLIRMT